MKGLQYHQIKMEEEKKNAPKPKKEPKKKGKKEEKKEEKKVEAKEYKVDLPNAEDLMKAGAHWGHMKHRVYPKNYPNIHGIKSNTHVINSYKSIGAIEKALQLMKRLKEEGKEVLFVSTKPSMRALIKEFGEKMNVPYIDERWVGGTFTNFEFIEKSINKLKKLKSDFKTGDIKKYPRHEQLEFKREMEKLESKYGGIQSMNIKKLGAVFIQDLKCDKNALREASQEKIPVIALVDTNINPTEINYPIPYNDDSYEAFKLLLGVFEKNLG